MPDTPLARYLAALSPAARRHARAWIASRPPAVRALIERYPPGTRREINGRPAWVVSYAEVEGGPPGLYFSHADPHADYDGAVASRFFAHVDCLEGADV